LKNWSTFGKVMNMSRVSCFLAGIIAAEVTGTFVVMKLLEKCGVIFIAGNLPLSTVCM